MIARWGAAVGWTLVWTAVFLGLLSLFSYLCDDAYISFRYVHNLVNGRGLVWNPAPFRPVEGYTSLSWVVLLGAVWRWTGVSPVDAAPPILAACSVGTLVLTAWAVATWPLRHLAAVRGWLLCGTLAIVATNLTFLQWSTSGLEQALNTLLVVAWTLLGLRGRPGWTVILGLASLAALLELTRPDGLLFLGATVAVAVAWAIAHRNPAWIAALVPLAVPAVHLGWRYLTYGQWVPNTYFAKHAGAWPDMGLAYAAGFLLEYAGFLWIPPLIAAMAWSPPLAWVAGLSWERLGRWAVGLAVVAHFFYYTLSIGGDHFGFRIYHHLVPLGALGLIVALDHSRWRVRDTLAWLALTAVAGNLIPWSHWAITRDAKALEQRGEDPHLLYPHWPLPLAGWPALWDAQQAWTRHHFVGIRHRAHVHNIERLKKQYPSREQGESYRWDHADVPIIHAASVGYPAWVLPNVAVIDKLGLNDAIIAHTPLQTGQKRKMAHDRRPPPGYLACLAPNLKAIDGRLVEVPREAPISEQAIRACELQFWTHGP